MKSKMYSKDELMDCITTICRSYENCEFCEFKLSNKCQALLSLKLLRYDKDKMYDLYHQACSVCDNHKCYQCEYADEEFCMPAIIYKLVEEELKCQKLKQKQ